MKFFFIFYLLLFTNNKNFISSNNSLFNDDNKQSKEPKFFCNKLICDEQGGKCENNICICKENYSTYFQRHNKKLCNYKRISSIKSAFLELFIGFGCGHFYADRYVNGSLKLILYSFLICISCCSLAIGIKLGSDQEIDQNNPIVKIFLLVYIFICNGMMIWQLLDFFLFLFKAYDDGNGIPLY